MALSLGLNSIKTVNWDSFFNMYREPIVTYCITPNNAPDPKGSRGNGRGGRSAGRGKSGRDYFFDDSNDDENLMSDNLMNEISGLFNKFYLPERLRFSKNGIKIKLNDIVSYKVVFENSQMKFYLTVPEKFSKSFINAVKQDWGNVDINIVERDIIKFNPTTAKAMNIILRHHYSMSIRHDKKNNSDLLYPSLSSLGAILSPDDKLVIDFNIESIGDTWKMEARKKYDMFKKGKMPNREQKNVSFLIWSALDFANLLVNETLQMITDIMGATKEKEEEKKELFDPKFTNEKLHPNTKGFQVQTRVIAESNDAKKSKHILRNVQSAFEALDGDNKFTVKHIKTKSGVKSIIKAVEECKPQLFIGKDVFFEGEMNQLVKLPNKQTLKEFKKVIQQDNFTRTEINGDFFKDEFDALPFASTLDKDSKILYFPSYGREDWTDKGRYVKEKTKLDDRCTATLVFGRQGSGKTELSVRQILSTFLCGIITSYKEWKLANPESTMNEKEWEQYSFEEWKKRSKSVVAFDVADGEILTKVWNHIPKWLKNRVVVLNHSVTERPIPVNFSELEEFNREVMQDPDYAYRLAEMESDLIHEILGSEKSISVERWFKYALQCVHYASPDFGIPEAIKMLVDDEFRIQEIMPMIQNDEELLLEMEAYNEMSMNGETSKIVTTIQNRLGQIKAERKLWDCIAQKPLRDENGKCAINFRKWLDGDADGAYLVMVYIPKDASQKFRKFLFAHYIVKIWCVGVSREKGFAGREYRPEALIVIDEIHQVIDVSVIGKMFIDLFKEPRKYSMRYWFTLHGWSSLAKAGRGIEGDIKQSIMDNGCNLIMLKGGEDAFDSLENFMGDMTIEDYNNLMKTDFCGIFSIWWKGCQVFQGKMLPEVSKTMRKYDSWDLYDLASYVSPYSRGRDDVRKENLNRVKSMIKRSIINESSSETELAEGVKWQEIEEDGTSARKRKG